MNRFKYFFIYLIGLLAGLGISCNNKTSNQEEPIKIARTIADDLLDTANYYIDSLQYDTAIRLLDSALTLESSIKTKAECYAAIGYSSFMREEYPKAIENYLEAIGRFQQLNDTIRVAQMWMNTATSYKIIGNFDKAVKNAFFSLKILSKDSIYRKQVAIIYNLLGNIEKELGSYNTAKEYLLKSLEIGKLIPKYSSVAVINNIGNIFYEQGNYDSALIYFQNYKKQSIKLKNKKKIGRSYINIATVYLNLNEYSKCQNNIDSAFFYHKKIEFKKGLMALRVLKARLYLNSDIEKSENEALKALKTCEKLKLQRDKLEVVELLINIYLKKGSSTNALKYFIKLRDLQESLNRISALYQVHSYKMNSRLAEKNAEMKIVEAEKIQSEQEGKVKASQRNFLVVLFLLALSLIYLFYSKYKEGKLFVQEYFTTVKGVILKSGIKIDFKEIERIETRRNDLILIIKGEEIVEKNTTLKEFIPGLPKIYFGRPQRGIVVNFDRINTVLKTKFKYKEESINISTKYRDDFLESWSQYQKLRKGNL